MATKYSSKSFKRKYSSLSQLKNEEYIYKMNKTRSFFIKAFLGHNKSSGLYLFLQHNVLASQLKKTKMRQTILILGIVRIISISKTIAQLIKTILVFTCLGVAVLAQERLAVCRRMALRCQNRQTRNGRSNDVTRVFNQQCRSRIRNWRDISRCELGRATCQCESWE